MSKLNLVQGLIANGFKVVDGEGLDIYYQDEFLLTIEKDKVAKLEDAVTELSEKKYGQLLYLIKKYQGLLARPAVTEFKQEKGN